jgi:hypothetical protein
MIASVLGQLLNTAVASKKQMIGPIITKIVVVLIGGILLLAGFVFVLVTIYHALAPEHFTRAEAAGLMAVTLLVVGAIVVLVALKKSNGKPASLAAAATTDPQLAELTAIQALGMLNKALTDLSKGRGGGTAMIGVLGLAALVGFVSGRKR